MLLSRNLILQGFLEFGGKSCKREITFAIHQISVYNECRLLEILLQKNTNASIVLKMVAIFPFLTYTIDEGGVGRDDSKY